MKDLFSALFDVHKLPFRIVLWVAVVSGALVMAPAGFRTLLGLDDFMKAYRGYVGVVFLAFGSLVGLTGAGWSINKVRGWHHRKHWLKNLGRVINGLDHAEKAVLREFLIHGENTIDLPMDNATVVGLENKGIVTREGSLGRHTLAGMLFAYRIVDEAKNLLSSTLLDYPEGNPSPQEVDQIRRARPAFAREIERERWLLDR